MSLGSPGKGGVERRVSTGSILFAYFGSGFAKTFGQITSGSNDTQQEKHYRV